MKTMILSAGGLRSLVATALVQAEPRKQTVWLLHVKRRANNAARQLDFARKQAVHFHACKLIEIDEPAAPVEFAATGLVPSGPSPAPHAASFESLLETVTEFAADAGVERLLWPAQFDGEFSRLAALTEETLLLRHRLAARKHGVPRIETPLAELTDRQLLELGAVMNVPWQLAWSCAGVEEQPCGQCNGCHRRAAAFKTLLLDDPLIPTTHAKRSPLHAR
ncbi:MAG: 7-cyano-7-deazaguanine synthase [Phycisphaeraceae bacterium]